MSGLSVVILSRNEERNIGRCLRSVSWASETIVVDDFSSDNTVSIARGFGAKVYKRALADDFSRQRNFGLSKATGEWVLFVDADEYVSGRLGAEIRGVIGKREFSGFMLTRKDIFLGKKMRGGEWGETALLRLARKRAGRWNRRVHEVWEVGGRVGKLSSPLLHSPTRSLFDFVAKLNYYSSLHAASNSDSGKSANFLKIIFMPFFKFLQNYLIKRGYRDGAYGFVMAVLMSLHSFLSWSKQWQEQRK